MALRASFFMLKSRVSRISGRSGSPSDAPASSIRYGSIARLYSHRAGISRIFGLFSIGTLGKGGGLSAESESADSGLDSESESTP